MFSLNDNSDLHIMVNYCKYYSLPIGSRLTFFAVPNQHCTPVTVPLQHERASCESCNLQNSLSSPNTKKGMCGEARIVISFHIKQDHFNFSLANLRFIIYCRLFSVLKFLDFQLPFFQQRQYYSLSYRSSIYGLAGLLPN